MLVCIPNVLDAGATRQPARAAGPRQLAWVDGRVTAGYQGAPVKFNQQIDERSEVALACQRIVVVALERHPLFISAVLPNVIYPPMFNRYSEGMKFGAHVDGSVRISPHDGRKLRTDVSATLFLTNPEEYDGGELADRGHLRPPQHQAAGRRHGGLSGDQPAPGGADHARRAHGLLLLGAEPDPRRCPAGVLHEMDNAIQRLNQTNADEVARRSLIGCYHNLVRQWSET